MTLHGLAQITVSQISATARGTIATARRSTRTPRAPVAGGDGEAAIISVEAQQHDGGRGHEEDHTGSCWPGYEEDGEKDAGRAASEESVSGLRPEASEWSEGARGTSGSPPVGSAVAGRCTSGRCRRRERDRA